MNEDALTFLVLIGSQARGDANIRSDVDALVVGSPPTDLIETLRGSFNSL